MKKMNPLFVDSTKNNADNVGMDIELNNLMLHDGEKVFLYVTLQNGDVIVKELSSVNANIFSFQLWLKHQEYLQLQFVVVNEKSEPMFSSPIVPMQGSYYFSYEWQICDIETLKFISEEKTLSTHIKESVKEEDPLDGNETVQRAKSLLTKWGL